MAELIKPHAVHIICFVLVETKCPRADANEESGRLCSGAAPFYQVQSNQLRVCQWARMCVSGCVLPIKTDEEMSDRQINEWAEHQTGIHTDVYPHEPFKTFSIKRQGDRTQQQPPSNIPPSTHLHTCMSRLSCLTMRVMVSMWFSSSLRDRASTCKEPWVDCRPAATSSLILKACSSSTASVMSWPLRRPSKTSGLDQETEPNFESF